MQATSVFERNAGNATRPCSFVRCGLEPSAALRHNSGPSFVTIRPAAARPSGVNVS